MTKHDKREKYLDSWAVTILRDHAYLSGLDEDDKNVEEKEVRKIIFIDAEAEYIKEEETVDAIPPGFQITTDSGIYWCSCLSPDRYTLADTSTSLSRIMMDDAIALLTNPQRARNKMHSAIEEYRIKHGITREYDEVTFD